MRRQFRDSRRRCEGCQGSFGSNMKMREYEIDGEGSAKRFLGKTALGAAAA
jgi:hypothetical protein